MSSLPLKGKTILVTGASKGIGLVIARTLYRDGANVIIHYSSNMAPALALESEFAERGLAIQADLSNPNEIQSLWRNALNWRGHIDVLVNNAGVYVSSPLDNDDDWRKDWNTNLQVNLIAAADLCRYSIQHFENMGAGIIINMASRSSHRGDNAEHLAYGAAKGGLLALTKGIARGFAGKNILAYALAPGWVRTEMAEAHIAAVGEDVICEALPLKEVTPPSDIAEMISFLATGKVRHATGSTIDITGADYVR
ncbi:SDR family NAD(P)-dependent oxidoreductase [Marinomonas sp. PE14-40]|uniref:SDR family NAD(P)-dependent oxidoreductase n=1 Tax=Marinomonas sp. PE14-40 TaxID=3060621 RepID=UPI003F677B29